MVRTNTVSVPFKPAQAQQERRGRSAGIADSAQAAAQGWDSLPAGLLDSVLQVFARTGTHFLPASLPVAALFVLSASASDALHRRSAGGHQRL